MNNSSYIKDDIYPELKLHYLATWVTDVYGTNMGGYKSQFLLYSMDY